MGEVKKLRKESSQLKGEIDSLRKNLEHMQLLVNSSSADQGGREELRFYE